MVITVIEGINTRCKFVGEVVTAWIIVALSGAVYSIGYGVDWFHVCVGVGVATADEVVFSFVETCNFVSTGKKNWTLDRLVYTGLVS